MATECNLDPVLIERYLDGELGRADTLRVQKHIETCSTCQARTSMLRLSSELLNVHLEKAVQDADFSDFEHKVMQNIGTQQKLPLGQRLAAWLKESLDHHRTAWVAAAAAAVIVIVMALAGSWSSPMLPSSAITPPDQKHTSASDKTHTARADNDVIIDQLEYQGKKSMIFTVSKNNTTVIWMYDFDRPGSKSSEGDEI